MVHLLRFILKNLALYLTNVDDSVSCLLNGRIFHDVVDIEAPVSDLDLGRAVYQINYDVSIDIVKRNEAKQSCFTHTIANKSIKAKEKMKGSVSIIEELEQSQRSRVHQDGERCLRYSNSYDQKIVKIL